MLLRNLQSRIDWVLMGAVAFLLIAGLATMFTLDGDNTFFIRQVVWIFISFGVMLIVSQIDGRVFHRTRVILGVYGIIVALLLGLFLIGSAFQGAQSWFSLGVLTLQPAEFAKLALILLLAKYFSRRHVEIKRFRHIVISGVYAGLLFLLIMAQPDFGSAIIVFAIWFGMILFSGISWKHLLLLIGTGAVMFTFFWTSVFADYQKDRIMSFLNPLQDLQGAGYNAYQSMVSVGSGGFLGKGFGFGTQSRLAFLPEYQTDFMFAAFAEEWGFMGSVFVIFVFAFILYRILRVALVASGNFEKLYVIGFACFIFTHVTIHTGINVGLLPVTGITIPFMSYGGTHMLVVFIGLGILFAIRGYARPVHKEITENEFYGVR